jgi:hypothetical protein
VLCAHWLGKTSSIGVVFARKPGLPTANTSPSIRGEGWVAVDARGSASSAETSPNSIEQGKAFQNAQSIAFDEDARPNLPYGAAALMNLDRPPFQGQRNGRAQTRNTAFGMLVSSPGAIALKKTAETIAALSRSARICKASIDCPYCA